MFSITSFFHPATPSQFCYCHSTKLSRYSQYTLKVQSSSYKWLTTPLLTTVFLKIPCVSKTLCSSFCFTVAPSQASENLESPDDQVLKLFAPFLTLAPLMFFTKVTAINNIELTGALQFILQPRFLLIHPFPYVISPPWIPGGSF